MTRTIQEISDAIKQEFVSNTTLKEAYELTDGKSFDEQFSKVSIEAILIYVFASSAWLLEQIWDAFKTEMEKRIDQAYVTSFAWYYQKALEFQYGDRLVFDEKSYSFKYTISDDAKRIVKNVAVRQVTDDNVTKLKIYFSDVVKNPIKGGCAYLF